MKRLRTTLYFIILSTLLTSSKPENSMPVQNNNSKPEIIYFFDPLCGWCYGMEPVMIQIQKRYKDQINFNVVPGGMVLKEQAEPIYNMKDFLISAIPGLEAKTGIKIGEKYYNNILNNKTIILNSELPSQAFELAKPSYKDQEVLLAKTIQDLLYNKGLDISKTENYKSIKGLDLKLLETKVAKDLADSAFKFTKKFGVTGFPTLILNDNGKYYKIASGYVGFDDLSGLLENYLKNK